MKRAESPTGKVHYVENAFGNKEGLVIPLCNHRTWLGDYCGKQWKLTDKEATCINCLKAAIKRGIIPAASITSVFKTLRYPFLLDVVVDNEHVISLNSDNLEVKISQKKNGKLIELYQIFLRTGQKEGDKAGKVRCPDCRTIMTLIKQVHGTPTHYWKCRKCGKVVC